MSAIELLEKLDALGISCTPDGERLLVRPASKLPPNLAEEIKVHKAELLAICREPDAGDAEIVAALNEIPADATWVGRLVERPNGEIDAVPERHVSGECKARLPGGRQ